MNSTVLTEQMNMMFRHMWFSKPGSLNHHKNVAIDAKISSTYMPAAPTAARFHLSGCIHESETLQYSAGVNTSSMKPISWHSPPTFLHDSPWPSSCRIFVPASVNPSSSQFPVPKKLWNAGSRAMNVSN